MPSCCVDDVVLNGQVLEEELAREIVVGFDAADFGCGQKDVFRTFTTKEVVDRLVVAKV